MPFRPFANGRPPSKLPLDGRRITHFAVESTVRRIGDHRFTRFETVGHRLNDR